MCDGVSKYFSAVGVICSFVSVLFDAWPYGIHLHLVSFAVISLLHFPGGVISTSHIPSSHIGGKLSSLILFSPIFPPPSCDLELHVRFH